MTLLEENIMIGNTQHDFRNKRFCLTNFFDFYNDVFNFYDDTKVVDIIYLAFIKHLTKSTKNKIVTWHSLENSSVA